MRLHHTILSRLFYLLLLALIIAVAPSVQAQQTCTVGAVSVDDANAQGAVTAQVYGTGCNIVVEIGNPRPYWVNLRLTPVGNGLQVTPDGVRSANLLGHRVLPPEGAIRLAVTFTAPGQSVIALLDGSAAIDTGAREMTAIQALIDLFSLTGVIDSTLPFDFLIEYYPSLRNAIVTGPNLQAATGHLIDRNWNAFRRSMERALAQGELEAFRSVLVSISVDMVIGRLDDLVRNRGPLATALWTIYTNYSAVFARLSSEPAGFIILTAERSASEATVPSVRTIAIGESASGTLVVGQRDTWRLEAAGGETVQINMDADFDTYLELYGPDGAEVARNDDFNGLNAQITAALPSAGTYTIIARAYADRGGGPYSLRVSAVGGRGTSSAAGSWEPITADNAGRITELMRLGLQMDLVFEVAYAPDGRTLALASSIGVVLYDTDDLSAEPRLLEGHTGYVLSVAWSPDGARLASASDDGTVRVWDVASGQPLATLTGHTGRVVRVAWSPDGARLASASVDDSTVRLWDAASSVTIAVLQAHGSGVFHVVWSPDGARLASASGDGTVRLWDAVTGQPLTVLRGHTSWVWSVAWSPDGARLASASQDGTVRVWDAASGATLATLTGHTGGVNDVAWSPEGARLASASADGTVRVWDAATGATLATLTGHTDVVASVAWSPEGARLVSASADGTVRVWDAATGQSITISGEPGHRGVVESVAWSPDGARLASASEDGTVRVWDAVSGAPLTVLEVYPGRVESVAWSPDGARLASTSVDGTVRVWDVASGATLATLTGHMGLVTGVAWSPDGARLASASVDGTVRVWDAASGATLTVLQGHTHYVQNVAWSPDGARLASASVDGTVRVWDAVTGQSLTTLQGHTDVVTSVAWSPDGARLASASEDGTVRVWDAASGATLTVLQGHTHYVQNVAWSPDGARLASASWDGTVRVWDAASGQSLAVLQTHMRMVNSVAWSPDGARLASASADGTVRVWGVPRAEGSASGAIVPSVRTIAIGESASGTLVVGQRDTWRLEAAGGETVQINMDADFDTYLELYGPDGAEVARNDDFNGLNLSADR